MSSSAESTPFLKSGSPTFSPLPPIHRPKRPWYHLPPLPTTTNLLPIILTSLLWSLFLFLLLLTYPSSPKWHPNNAATYGSFFGPLSVLSTCGTTPTSALAAGCQYDILANHWVPSQCYDAAAVAEYQADATWTGYADENRTQPIPWEDLGRVETGFYYTTMRDHIVHCAALWKKQFRVFAEARGSMDFVVVDGEHTMHCADFLVDVSEGGGWRDVGIKVFVGYAPCWIREG